MKATSSPKGFSLIEMLVYLTILSLVFIVIVNTMLSFTTSYRTLSAHRIIEHSAMSSLERMTRDIRSATSIDSANSTFGSTTGMLTIVSTHNSVSTTTKFYLDTGKLKVDVNNTYLGPLTTTNVTVTDLTYTLLTGSTTIAVKIDMTLQSTNGSFIKTNTYHSTVVLKES
jgi:prepilin-type N-terminal cleavage/methylation domain-containing protein